MKDFVSAQYRLYVVKEPLSGWVENALDEKRTKNGIVTLTVAGQTEIGRNGPSAHIDAPKRALNVPCTAGML